MEIGDVVTARVTALEADKKGTVVYIHPEKRFYVVEFKGLFGSFRESYKFPVPPIIERRSGSHYFNL